MCDKIEFDPAKSAALQFDTVDDLLEFDRRARRPGAQKPLMKLETLIRFPWNQELPTIEGGGCPCPRHRNKCAELVPTASEFAEKFYSRHPILKGVNLTDLLIAGGSVCNAILGGRGTYFDWRTDIDVFMYGYRSTADFEKRALRFVRDLEENMKEMLARDLSEEIYRKSVKHASPPKGSKHWAAQKIFGTDAGDGESEDKCFDLLIPYWKRSGRGGMEVDLRELFQDDPNVNETCYLIEQSGLRLDYILPETTVVRSPGCITISMSRDTPIVQIILRQYKTKEEILYGFDLGSCACGFDGQNVYLTPLGAYALERGVNIVDTTRRSLSYEHRLWKYFGRGFNIVLPEIDIGKVRAIPLGEDGRRLFELPRLTFYFTKVDDNIIEWEEAVEDSRGYHRSDYDGDASDFIRDDIAKYGLLDSNLKRLLKGETTFTHFATGRHLAEVVKQALTNRPHLSRSVVKGRYNIIRLRAWDGKRLNVGSLQAYFPHVDWQPLLGSLGDKKKTEKLLRELADKQLDIALKLWDKNIGQVKRHTLQWVTQNPAGQQSLLSGSFNPIMEDPEEWYGAYYLPKDPRPERQ